MLEYRAIAANELSLDLFKDFIRHQVVTDCWRRVDGKWDIQADPFIDDWSAEDYAFLVKCLKNTLATKGFIFGVFENKKLKGFVSVEGEFIGDEHQYCDLSSLHVSEELRNRGIGRWLFVAAKQWANQHGAKKLYISAHSAVETQAFYRGLGCVDAQWLSQGTLTVSLLTVSLSASFDDFDINKNALLHRFCVTGLALFWLEN